MFISMALYLASHMQDSKPEDKAPYESHGQSVTEWMQKAMPHGTEIVDPVAVKEPGFSEIVHGTTFHSVHYSEFPIARMPPKPLAIRSLFSVNADGKVMLYTSRESFRKDFLGLTGILTKDNLPILAMGYIKVSSTFTQDGYYKFIYDMNAVTIAKENEVTIVNVSAPVDTKNGDLGKLTATLRFKPGGIGGYKLDAIEEKDTVQPGMRPICQCTLLLDKNPLVRRIAERDLLIMGESARGYMLEQRAKARPALQREIDRVWARIERGER